jgi:hypothetical protein
VPGQLVGPERTLAEFSDSLPPLRQPEVGEVARWTRHDDSIRFC